MSTSTPAPKQPYHYKTAWGGDFQTRPEGFTADELNAMNKCGSDAVFTASILFPPDGSYSILFRSFDGRTGEELDDNEWFKIWMMLTNRLSKSETLDEGRREFTKSVFDVIREAMTSASCSEPECSHHAKD